MSKSINKCILLALKYAYHEPVGGVPVKEALAELADLEAENATKDELIAALRGHRNLVRRVPDGA